LCEVGVGGRWGAAGPEKPTDTTYHRVCLVCPFHPMHIERLLVGPGDELGMAQARIIASYGSSGAIGARYDRLRFSLSSRASYPCDIPLAHRIRRAQGFWFPPTT